jgi:O-antigen/teichoic acid export membrane protein
MDNSAVAHYRIYSIIPFNLFFLAALFFQTAYPKLCEKHLDHPYQLHFLFNFWKLMIPVSLVILLVSFFGAEFILKFFGNDYYQNTIVFRILIVASVSVLLLRTPFGYLLASKGKSKYNLISAIISIISLVVFIKPIIANYGLEGVAWLSLGNLVFIGFFLFCSYFYEIKKTSKT